MIILSYLVWTSELACEKCALIFLSFRLKLHPSLIWYETVTLFVLYLMNQMVWTLQPKLSHNQSILSKKTNNLCVLMVYK